MCAQTRQDEVGQDVVTPPHGGWPWRRFYEVYHLHCNLGRRAFEKINQPKTTAPKRGKTKGPQNGETKGTPPPRTYPDQRRPAPFSKTTVRHCSSLASLGQSFKLLPPRRLKGLHPWTPIALGPTKVRAAHRIPHPLSGASGP